MIQRIIDDFLERLEIFIEMIKDIIFFDENGDFFHEFFYNIANNIQNFVANNFNILYNTWIVSYDLYPNWIISVTGLIILLSPYVIWVTTNILILIIIFLWYFTIFLYNYLSDKEVDVYLKIIILKIIIKFRFFINILKFFKFNYDLLFDLFFSFMNYLNYTKNSKKYNYDLYGNKLILIKKSSLLLFKNFIYINMYINNIYHHNKIKMDWRSVLTFHIDEKQNEDPEDFEQVILGPLQRFKDTIFQLKFFENVSKYSIFDKFSKRRRFNFYYNIKQSFFFYFIINIKKIFISLIIISFFNIILLNIFMKILKYITNL